LSNSSKSPALTGGGLTVHIIGGGPTVLLYDWPDATEKWTVGSMFPVFGDRADLFFCLHGEILDTKKPVIDRENYPLSDVCRIIGGREYFTSSVAYMIALAILRGATKIKTVGIDLDYGGEYESQKPCVLFWLGIALGRGIEVESNLIYAHDLYGYNTGKLKPVIEKLTAGMRQHAALLVAADKNGKEIDKAVHSGIYQGFEAALNIIKG